MSLSKLVLVVTLLYFLLPTTEAAKAPSATAKAAAAATSGKAKKKEKGEGKSKNKMSLEGGLYTTDKVSVIKS